MIHFWNNLFRRRQLERDLNDELQSYVEEMAERKIQAGFDPETAREAALMELGSMARIKELVRQQRIGFGNIRRAGSMGVVAIIAFVSGANDRFEAREPDPSIWVRLPRSLSVSGASRALRGNRSP
jgi:hypothetical protein